MTIDEVRLSYLAWLAVEDAAEELYIRTARDYADGRHPTYLTNRQREFLGLKSKDQNHPYAHNLCQLVIDSVVERLEVIGFEEEGVAESELTAMAVSWWEQNRMDAYQDTIYEASCRDGEAFIIVDWDAARQCPTWTLNLANDGTQGVKLHRDPSTDNVLFASKRWQVYNPADRTNNGRTRMNLYHPDRVEKYISGGNSTIRGYLGDQIVNTMWAEYRDAEKEPWPVPWVRADGQPLGCAVIGFTNPGGSELAQLMPIQDMLNKSDLDTIAASDAAGFRMLYVAGMEAQIGDDGKEKPLSVGPGRVIRMSSPDAKLGAIEPVDLTRMIAGSKYWIESAAGITRTPQYLFQAQGADQPSGESLKQQEIGLVNKCRRRQRVWGNSWEDVIYLSRNLHNLYAQPKMDPESRLQTQWVDIQPNDPMAEAAQKKAEAEAALLRIQAGASKEAVLAELGYTQEQITEMAADTEAGTAEMADQLLTNFERGQ